MKRTTLSILLLCGLFVTTLAAHNMSGVWNGKLDIQGNLLPLVFHISDELDDDGLPTITMDSPNQGATDINCVIDYWDTDSLAIRVPSIMMAYTGKLLSDNFIKGEFSQMGTTLPLDLSRGKLIRLRPQTPQPPYPYVTEEVIIPGENTDIELHGTLTLPSDASSDTPIVLLLSGSGLQDRDETIFGHKPFLLLADRLARAGIGSLRYDERGIGESKGDATHATTTDFAGDALMAFEWLHNRGFQHRGILGHSEGALIAMTYGNNADFIITLGAPAISGFEIMLDQINTSIKDMGYEDAACESVNNVLEKVFYTICSNNGTREEIVEIAQRNMLDNMELWSSPFSPAWPLLKILQQDLPTLLTDWMIEFLCTYPDENEVTVPMLALYGSKDSQVRPELNVPALKEIVPQATIKVYEGLNHLMQPCKTGKSAEYAEIETTIDEQVISDIINFIKEEK